MAERSENSDNRIVTAIVGVQLMRQASEVDTVGLQKPVALAEIVGEIVAD